jgi:N-acylneuraminate cytidylyltransferase
MKRHSARVPGKNVRPLHGRPLCLWTLQTLAALDEIGTIVVDTDAPEIADLVRRELDVEISIRPESLRGDFTPTNDLIAYVMAQHPTRTRFLQTHVTNPLLTAPTVADAIRRFETQVEHDSLFSVTRLQTRLYDERGTPVNHDPARLLRTQDLPPLYEENSNLYLFTRESFAVTGSRIGSSPLLFEMNRLEALDIDEESDFTLAEALMRMPACARTGGVPA